MKKKKVGRPVGPDGPAKVVSFSLPSSVYKELEKICKREKLGKSAIINKAILEYSR